MYICIDIYIIYMHIFIYIVINEKTNNIYTVKIFRLLPLSIHNLSLAEIYINKYIYIYIYMFPLIFYICSTRIYIWIFIYIIYITYICYAYYIYYTHIIYITYIYLQYIYCIYITYI